MFFNHLFSLTTLKNRLLNATSFSQVYSGEKLPLHKFRKEGAMLSPLIAGGAGDDIITLGANADKVIYQFDSDTASGWQGVDNDDTVNGFTRGVDKLVLIDIATDSPITSGVDFTTLLNGTDTNFETADDEIQIALLNPDSDTDFEGVTLTFAGGSALTLNFTTALTQSESQSYTSLGDLLDGSVDSFESLEFTTLIDIV